VPKTRGTKDLRVEFYRRYLFARTSAKAKNKHCDQFLIVSNLQYDYILKQAQRETMKRRITETTDHCRFIEGGDGDEKNGIQEFQNSKKKVGST
jgi:hypothetical protein